MSVVLALAMMASFIALLPEPALRPYQGPPGPNILIIGIDSLRFDHFSPSFMPATFRALVEDSQTVSFQDHHVGIPRTFPSWLEILSGQPAAVVGVRHMFPSFIVRNTLPLMLPGYLKSDGYISSAISDFAGDIFPRFNADFAHIEAPTLTLPYLVRMGADQSFPLLFPFMLTSRGSKIFPALKEVPAFSDPHHLIEDYFDFANLMTTRKHLATVFFSTAHFPYAAPWPWYVRNADHAYAGRYYFQKNPSYNDTEDITDADTQKIRALYTGALGAIDVSLGKLFKALKDSGRWHDLLIILTADHGEDLYENGLSHGHGEHLRGQNVLHVPLVIKLPGSVGTPKNRVYAGTSRSIDITPTVLGALGKECPTCYGVNLLPGILGGKDHEPALSAYAETGIWFSDVGKRFFQKQRMPYPSIHRILDFNPQYSDEITLANNYENVIVLAKHRSFTDGPYKLIYNPTPQGVVFELYDRQRDPDNLNNLATQKPKKVQELWTKLLAYIAKTEPKAYQLGEFIIP